jgi:microcystin-dependent protein
MQQYLGMIILFGGNFAISQWQICAGQTLAISQYTALFSILGTYYGGNGVSTFQLPDLRGRVAIGMGQGPGLSDYVIGQNGGSETISLIGDNLPSHNHTASLTVTVSASVNAATAQVPVSGASTIGTPSDPLSGDTINLYNSDINPGVALLTNGVAKGSTGNTGNSKPVSIIQPYLTLNYLIALSGIFPTRN